MKFYSLCFCLFLLLNFSPSFQSACEDVENPSGFSDCKGKATSDSNIETCCFNKYSDSDGKGLKECVEINKTHAFYEDKLDEAEELIEKGSYWEDYTKIYDDVDLQCASESQCEKVDDPNDFSSCKGKTTESSSETCCFARYIESDDDDDETECVDIKKEDAEDEDKLKEAEDKIKKGKYWDDYYDTYKDIEIDCGSAFLKGIFVALFAVFIF